MRTALITISEAGQPIARTLQQALQAQPISRTATGQCWNDFDAFIFMVGVQQDYFKVGYSYDVTLSQLGNSTAGSHEITIGILLPVPEQKHKVKAIRCPSF